MAKAPKKHRVSRIFKLGRSQATLDFVDVDIKTDTPVFLSPRALALLPSEWGDGCVALVHNFFQTVLDKVVAGQNAQAVTLLETLKEPNETHLGLSRGKSRGRALGTGSAQEVWQAVANSQAAKTGLLRDLEDTVLLIPGVGVDIVSDITTNIIRAPLIEYTQETCRRFGIPLTPGIDSGPLWDPAKREWFSKYVELPMTSEGKLLLVPKAIVRRHTIYDLNEYYRHYILENLKKVELDANSSLVYLLKDGTRKVNKSDLEEKYGRGKNVVIEQTLQHPDWLEAYKAAKADEEYIPLSHEDLADVELDEAPDWDALLKDVVDTPVGAEHAPQYERAIESLLTALFYPDLTNPVPQSKLHDGRKRVDIQYTNMAIAGFFKWISSHYPSGLFFIECKNYGSEVANPELDQISGRFSPSRGKVGILTCRQFKDKSLFLTRCRDTAQDHRGFVIALDDSDLSALVEARKSDKYFQQWSLLKQRFVALIN